jgi:hypothetical protein
MADLAIPHPPPLSPLFVLIVTSTYTANLASFFTKQSYAVEGPRSV